MSSDDSNRPPTTGDQSQVSGQATGTGDADPLSSERPTVLTPPARSRSSHDHGETTRLPIGQDEQDERDSTVTDSTPRTMLSASGAGPQVMAIGELIADRYQVRKVLGVGGMGEVYRVHDQALQIDVALKVLRSEMATDRSFSQRFRNELLVARQVTHPNVVRIHDLGQHGPLLFMTMDLVEGRSLAQLMDEEGALGKERSIAIMKQVAAALAEAHDQGIVHRDLKPANILLDAENRAFVTDFGIARSRRYSGLTRTGEVLGTPDYLAPEQARGEEVSSRTDVYALGLIFFEMISGKRPFAGGTLVEVLAQHMNGRTRSFKELGVDVDPALEAVVARCLATEPKERYASTTDLLADIDNLKLPRRRARLAKLKKAAVAIMAATVIVAALVFAWPRLTAPPASPPPVAPVESAPATVALPAVALLPFDNRTGDSQLDAWAEAGIAEELAAPLLEAGAVRVVQGRRVQRVLDDLGFSVADLGDADLGTLAQVLDARRLVTGSLRGLGDRLQLAVQLVAIDEDAVSRQVVYDQMGESGHLLAAVSEAAGALRTALELPVSEARPATVAGAEIGEQARLAYYEGIAHRDAGRIEAALEALARATTLEASYAEAWLAVAAIHREQGRSDDALAAAEQAAATAFEGSRTAYEARALEALAGGRPEVAQRELQKLVELFPGDTSPRLALARAFGDQGQLDQAVAVLEQALQLDPSEIEAWFLLGQYSILRGEASQAVNDYLIEAQKLASKAKDQTGEARILNALGVGYEQIGDPERAIGQYQQAADLYERRGDMLGSAKTSFNLGRLNVSQGDHEAAEAHLGQALSLYGELGNPGEQAKVINAFGVLEEERGRYQAALDYYRRGLQLRQQLGDDLLLAESFLNVGFAHSELGSYTDAVLNLQQAEGLFQNAGSAFGIMLAQQSLGSCQIAQGRWSEALTTLHEALEIGRELGVPDAQAASHGYLGRVGQLQGRFEAAFVSYDQSLEILNDLGDRRGQVEFTLAKAETLLELADVEAAGALLEQARGWLDPGGSHSQQSTLHRLLAAWHVARGEAAEAAEAAATALTEAEASAGAVVLLRARLASSPSAAELGELWREVGTLGHVPLQLAIGEALITAALDAGDNATADDVLRRTQALVRQSGGYAGGYRLHLLRARLHRERGDEASAVRAEANARTEVERLLRATPEQLRAGYLARPEIARLGVSLPAS